MPLTDAFGSGSVRPAWHPWDSTADAWKTMLGERKQKPRLCANKGKERKFRGGYIRYIRSLSYNAYGNILNLSLMQYMGEESG